MTALMPDATAPATAKCGHYDDQGLLMDLFACPACNDLCDVYDQPRWMCPHCTAFGIAVAAQKAKQPTAPDKPTRIAGAWVLRTDARGKDWRKTWQAIDPAGGGGDEKTHVGLIRCSRKHLDQDQRGLCEMCQGMLRQHLADLPLLLHHLQAAIVGDHTFVEHGSHIAKVSEDSVALNWGERASKANRNVRLQLGRIAGACGYSYGGRRQTVPLFALRIIDQGFGQFVQRDDAPGLAADLSHAVRQAHLAIDRPLDLFHYGKCPDCGKSIVQPRVDDSDELIACPHADCSYSIKLGDLQDKILTENGDRLLSIPELVKTISWAGVTVTRHQIRHWIDRDKLAGRAVAGRVDFVDDPETGERRLIRREAFTGYPLREALSLAIEAQERANQTNRTRP